MKSFIVEILEFLNLRDFFVLKHSSVSRIRDFALNLRTDGIGSNDTVSSCALIACPIRGPPTRSFNSRSMVGMHRRHRSCAVVRVGRWYGKITGEEYYNMCHGMHNRLAHSSASTTYLRESARELVLSQGFQASRDFEMFKPACLDIVQFRCSIGEIENL